MESLSVKNAVRGLKMARTKRMKLRYLKLETLIDVAYQCGMDGRPVSLYIAAPPGSGKTWASKSLAGYQSVQYYDSAYSPNEYKKFVADKAPGTKLFIHDDLGLSSGWNMKEFVSAWMMMIKGKIDYKHFKTMINAKCTFSMICISTLDTFYEWKDIMQSQGLLDRMLVIQLHLSEETRKKYQLEAQILAETLKQARDPIARKPELREKHDPAVLFELDINPRDLTNFLNMSTYLTEPEIKELIAVVQCESPDFEI